MKFSILYVDDEIANLSIFKNMFRRRYTIFTATSAEDGLDILNKENIDLVISDQRMPLMSGVEFLKEVKLRYPQPGRILVTGYTDFDALKDAINEADIFQYVQKPWNETSFQLIIDAALSKYNLERKNEILIKNIKKKNDELSKLNADLIDMESLKQEFLQIINHEIRTPLNGLLGATELFKAELSNSDQTNYSELFRLLEQSVNRLEHFLMFSEKIMAIRIKKYNLQIQNIKIEDFINEIIATKDTDIQNKKQAINLNFVETDSILADKELLTTCINSLIGNAIKYNADGGSISITCKQQSNLLSIYIEDEGPGFPENVLNNLGGLFITDTDYKRQGSGLDLALIKLVTEAHSGHLDLKNKQNHGAIVDFTIKSLCPS